MRLLLCKCCKTLEQIEDFDGHPSEDRLLEELVRRHNERDPMAHGGEATLPLSLMHVSEKDWFENREQIIERINEEHKATGFDGWVYEAMNTYLDDAMKCYNQHGRPKQGCIDWWADSKRIGRPTAEGRQAVKDQYKLGERDPHICSSCPVASWVMTEQNAQAGLYKV